MNSYIKVVIKIISTFLIIVFMISPAVDIIYAKQNIESNETYDIFNKDKVNNVNIKVDKDDYNDMLKHPKDEEHKIGNVLYNKNKIKNAGIRAKGSSSLQYVANSKSHRYSYKLKFDKFLDQNLKGYTTINLNNNFADPSYMREYLTYDLLNEMKVNTPQFSYVNVSINGKLNGLYLAVENIDESYLENHFKSSKGNLYKGKTGASLEWHKGMSVKDTNLNQTMGLSNDTKILKFIKALNTGRDIEKYFNVDQYLRYLAVNTVTANMDSYQGTMHHNYYLYEENGKFTFIPWGFNRSIGGVKGNEDEQANMLIDEPTQGNIKNYPLVDKILSKPRYKKRYHQYVKETVNKFDNVESRVYRLRNLIEPSVKKDPTAFYSYKEFLGNVQNKRIDGYPGIVGFMNKRIENIQEQLNGEMPSYKNGEGISTKTSQDPDKNKKQATENFKHTEKIDVAKKEKQRKKQANNIINTSILMIVLLLIFIFINRFRRYPNKKIKKKK